MNELQQQMHTLACEVRPNAHVPYVDFKVGVCIRTPDNQLFTGVNFQNSALPLGQCAEPTAIGSMVTAGYQAIAEIMIVSDSVEVCAPCGGCRQQISEFASADTLIHLCDLNGIRKTMTMTELLPASFNAQTLEK